MLQALEVLGEKLCNMNTSAVSEDGRFMCSILYQKLGSQGFSLQFITAQTKLSAP